MKDDIDIIVFKILTYLYRKLKYAYNDDLYLNFLNYIIKLMISIYIFGGNYVK